MKTVLVVRQASGNCQHMSFKLKVAGIDEANADKAIYRMVRLMMEQTLVNPLDLDMRIETFQILQKTDKGDFQWLPGCMS